MKDFDEAVRQLRELYEEAEERERLVVVCGVELMVEAIKVRKEGVERYNKTLKPQRRG